MSLKWLAGGGKIEDPRYEHHIVITQPMIDNNLTIPYAHGYVPGVNEVDLYLNGIYQQRGIAYSETDGTSFVFASGTILEVDSVLTVVHNANNISLGNIRVVGNYSQLLLLPFPKFNEVAIVVDSKKFYKYGNGGWEEFVIPFTTYNIGVLTKLEKQQITDITVHTYIMDEVSYYPDTDNLLVFINGVKVDQDDYTEVDNITIEFHNDLPIGSTEIEFLVFSSEPWEEVFNHNITYGYSGDNIVSETVQVGTDTVKTTVYAYSNDANITTETITKGSKTIIKTYTYDPQGNITGISVAIQ
jgi:hypothetical protein